MSTISSFKSIENKYDVYRGKDCMETFCESLRQHAMKTIHFKKKKLNSKNPMKMQKSAIFVKKNLKIITLKIKNIVKIKYHCNYTGEYRDSTHSICNLKYIVAKEIHITFRRSNYDYQFIIIVLAEEFENNLLV